MEASEAAMFVDMGKERTAKESRTRRRRGCDEIQSWASSCRKVFPCHHGLTSEAVSLVFWLRSQTCSTSSLLHTRDDDLPSRFLQLYSACQDLIPSCSILTGASRARRWNCASTWHTQKGAAISSSHAPSALRDYQLPWQSSTRCKF